MLPKLFTAPVNPTTRDLSSSFVHLYGFMCLLHCVTSDNSTVDRTHDLTTLVNRTLTITSPNESGKKIHINRTSHMEFHINCLYKRTH